MQEAGSDQIGGPTELRAASSVLTAVIAAKRASRAELIESTGLSRMTVTNRLGALLAAGLVQETAETVASGGRPARVLALNPAFGVVLCVDLRESRIHLAVSDLTPSLLEREEMPYLIDGGPVSTLENIAGGLERMLARRQAPPFVLGIGIGLRAPVDHEAGCAVGPSILGGWDDFDVGGWMERRMGIPTVVENDVNLMTIFEYRRTATPGDPFLYVKMGTGIGSGLIAAGRLYRGAHGASGDIGHIQFAPAPAPLCRCGKVGCVEAHAAGWAIARDLSGLGYPAENATDVVDLVADQVPEAIRLLRQAGRTLGEVAAAAISMLNPRTLAIGGTLARAPEHLLAGVKELVYQRCLPLATRELTIKAVAPRDEACLVGAAHLVLDDVCHPLRIEKLLQRIHDRAAAATPDQFDAREGDMMPPVSTGP